MVEYLSRISGPEQALVAPDGSYTLRLEGAMSMSAISTLPALPVQEGVEFQHVPDFPGYCVGDDGSVWSCWKRHKRRGYHGRGGTYSCMELPWRQMSLGWHNEGYPQACLRRHGRRQTHCVHKLVALAFLGFCPPGMQVAHENGIPDDNRLCNLSYKTPLMNQRDRFRHGTHCRGERNPISKLTEAIVREARERYARGGISLTKLGNEYGVGKTAMRRAVQGVSWRHVE